VNIDGGSDSEDENLLAVYSVSGSNHLYHQVKFGQGRVAKFVVDTGSPVTFMSESSLLEMVPKAEIQPSSMVIKGVSGHNLPVRGETTVDVCGESGKGKLRLLVTSHGPSVLGLDGLRELSVNIVLSTTQTPTELPAEIVTLIKDCGKHKGGMDVPPVQLEVTGPPIFYRWH